MYRGHVEEIKKHRITSLIPIAISFKISLTLNFSRSTISQVLPFF